MTNKEARRTVKKMFGRCGDLRAFKQGPQTVYEIGLRGSDDQFIALGSGFSWGTAFASVRVRVPSLVDVNSTLKAEMKTAAEKAWDSLSRYKFTMAGYWAGVWVHLNRVGGFQEENPFADWVKLARDKGFGPQVRKAPTGADPVPATAQVEEVTT